MRTFRCEKILSKNITVFIKSTNEYLISKRPVCMPKVLMLFLGRLGSPLHAEMPKNKGE
ncbi:hypothetical protein CEXT_390511, partial [Caerostris extrusa]